MQRWRRLAVLVTLALASSAAGADKTWDNGASNYFWDTVSQNWTGTTWNAAGDSAIFSGNGVGFISVVGTINVGSLNLTGGVYTLSGSGGLTIAPGATGTQSPNSIIVAGSAAQFPPLAINVPIASSIGLYKDGGGTVNLGAPVTFTGAGTTPLLGDAVNLQIGVANNNGGALAAGGAGTVALTAANVLPTNTSVGIGNGWLNIGANDTTLSRLVYMNTVASGSYGQNGNNGVYGAGTLRVTGPIVVQANSVNSGFSNTLAANLDMNGGAQQFLLNTVATGIGYTALHVTGTLSDGSLFKSYNASVAGGIGLYGNNSYTGSTTINGSGFVTILTPSTGPLANVVAGTNATTILNVVNGSVTAFGANGSYGSATSVKLIGGGTLSLDSASSIDGTSGAPTVAASNNNDRLKDTAAVTLSQGSLRLVSAPGGTTSETYGSLNSARGFNTVTVSAAGGGTATLSATGAWTQGGAAVTQFAGITGTSSGINVSTTLGTTGFVKFGSTPNSVGGLIPQAYGTDATGTGFVKYDPTNGIILLAAGDYQSGFGSGGNVTIAASAGPFDSQTINALRSTATSTVSFNPGAALAVTSGQILSTSGTLTLDATTPNGTVAFGNVPATMLTVGTITDNAPLTGTAGLIKAGNGTLNINSGADLSGLTGTFTHASGTTTLNVPYADNIDIVNGTFNLRANLTTPGKTITFGNPDTPANTVGSSVSLNIQSTAVTTIADNLVVANGTNPTPTAFTASISQQGGSAGIVQEFQGPVTLNGPLSILGGGNTVNTILFSGPISGPGAFRVQNGTVRFTNTATNYEGPFILGNGGNTTLVTFDGVNASTTGTTTIGFGTGVVTSTRVRLSNPNAIPGGQITMLGGTLQPTASMTLPNAFLFSGGTNPASPSPAAIDVGTGLSVNLSGPLVSDPGTYMTVSKVNPGILALSGNSPGYTGKFAVNGGTLAVNAGVSAATVTVASGATLQGTGTLTSQVTLNAGGTLQGGNGGATATDVLRISGGLTLSGANTFQTVFAGPHDNATASLIDLGSATLTHSNGALTTITLIGTGNIEYGQTYTLTVARLGATSGLTLQNPPPDFTINPNPIGFFFSGTPTLSYDSVSNPQYLLISFVAAPIPEPAFVLLACGSVVGGLAAWRRRRSALKGDPSIHAA
jgi:autotransporter-associated beta strand protein